jgi:uncharacterized protein HemX
VGQFEQREHDEREPNEYSGERRSRDPIEGGNPMTVTTKAVAWTGAIFGTVSLLVLALVIGAMMYAGYKNSEQQHQQQAAAAQLKQGLTQDLQSLSKMEIKPMTEEDRRKWLSGAASPTGTPVK